MNLEARMDKEINSIENDESLTEAQKREEINYVYRQAREARSEQSGRYDEYAGFSERDYIM
jgi:hypothetical protein